MPEKRLFVSIRDLTGKDPAVLSGVIIFNTDLVEQVNFEDLIRKDVNTAFANWSSPRIQWTQLSPRDGETLYNQHNKPLHLDGYPVGVIVVRKLGEAFKPVVHCYQSIDSSMYPEGDIPGLTRRISRIAPEILVENITRRLWKDINSFKEQFVEFKNADWQIHFIYPNQVLGLN